MSAISEAALTKITNELKKNNSEIYTQFVAKQKELDSKELFWWLQKLSESGKLNANMQPLLAELYYCLW